MEVSVAYVCPNPEAYVGKVVGTGQCVAFLQKTTNVGHTSGWTPGERIKGAQYIAPGTAIATFINGVYPNRSSGNHAAIYISHDEHGIQVYDQWSGHAVSKRTIRYKAGDNDPSNDGDFYYVIE